MHAPATIPGLYPRLLGADWPLLAEPIRRAHTVHGAANGRGRFRIERGRHVVARTLGWLLNLPPASPEAEAQVTVTANTDGELWVRRFGSRPVVTRQYEATPGVLAERFGMVEFCFRLEVLQGSLIFHQVHVAVVAGPVRWRLPKLMAPTVEATEESGPQGLQVLVRLLLPAAGLLLSYQGMVEYAVEKP